MNNLCGISMYEIYGNLVHWSSGFANLQDVDLLNCLYSEYPAIKKHHLNAILNCWINGKDVDSSALFINTLKK